MFTLSMDGLVTNILMETIASEPAFRNLEKDKHQEKLIMMLLENAVAMGFVIHAYVEAKGEDRFQSTPVLAENWSKMFSCPMSADAKSIVTLDMHGSRSKIFGKR
jgi:hypothetical protein